MKHDTLPKAKRLVAGFLIVLGLAVGGGVTMDHHSASLAHGGSWNPGGGNK